MQNHRVIWVAAVALGVSLCIAAPAHAVNWPFKKKDKQQDSSQQDSSTSEQSSSDGTAAQSGKPAGHPAWMNANGEVIDASQAEEGYGQKVKGLNDWEGEIVGKPAPGSKFPLLKIGMPMKQVTDLVGQPTDQGSYVTGKAWIPFFHGSGTSRTELVYKGWGRLIFDSKAGFDSGANLIWIINSANESGYRQ